MKSTLLSLPFAAFALASLAVACDDDENKIGPSLSTGEVNITIDSLTFDLHATPIDQKDFDARSGNLLLGNLNVPEYGDLNCSFVTRLMCASGLNVPDSLSTPDRVDSCKIIMSVPRGDLTGDSLAPQKVSVYALTKQLPSGITNNFDPAGYFDPSSPLGTKSFTLSNICYSDSLFFYNKDKSATKFVDIAIDLPKSYGQEIFRQYRDNPSVFQWPQTFAQYMPGIFVNSGFGKGCVGNVQSLYFVVYYYHLKEQTTDVDGEKVTTVTHARDSVFPFSISPEVLSSNNISYKMSNHIKDMVARGETVVTTPGGYNTSFRFPAKEIVEKYNNGDFNLSMVSNLTMSIPAEQVENDFNIGTAPSLLLIKSSEVENFFEKNKLPDNVTSFTANYDAEKKQYAFSSMRAYILDILDKKEITDEDVEFTVVPVNITTETEKNYYGQVVGTYVTKCTPYTIKPTMTRLHTEKAMIVFSFTSQVIK